MILPLVFLTLTWAQLPIVLWHGLSQDCCTGETKMITDALKSYFPKTYVKSIRIGSTRQFDFLASQFGSINKQVNQICAELKKDSRLSQGFNAIGISQGGLMMRAYVERCSDGPKVHNLITLGTPHNGIMRFPGCVQSNSTVNATVLPDIIIARLPSSAKSSFKVSCEHIDKILDDIAYGSFSQDHVIPAQYFKNPDRMNEYLRASKFLADINNEKQTKNDQYKSNMLQLNKFIMYRFELDGTIVPSSSTWFGWDVNEKEIPMEETRGYKEDWIGLKSLNERGSIERLTLKGVHHTEYPVNFIRDDLAQWLGDGAVPMTSNLTSKAHSFISSKPTMFLVLALLI